MKCNCFAIVGTILLGSLFGQDALGQNDSLPLRGSYYEGTTDYRAQFYTDREYMKMFMNCRADYWFVVDENSQIKGEGLAIFDFDFSFDWPLIIKKRIRRPNAFGAALDPNVAIMLNPSTAAHKFVVSGVFVPEKPAATPGGKPEPATAELKFKWQDEKGELHLIVGGSPAGSGIPVAVGQPPAEGSVKTDIRSPRMYPFGSDSMSVKLNKDSGSGLLAGRYDYDGKGGADNVHVNVRSTVLETINYAAALNPASGHLVSPVGTYEGFLSQQVRYHTDSQCIGMLLSSAAEVWLTIDEQGKVRGEVVADYTLDFGVDWTLATKTGVSMAKSMGLPIDPSVAVVLDPATARQRFVLEGKVRSPGRPDAPPKLLAPEVVTLELTLKPGQQQQLRILTLGELSGAATPTVAGTTAAAATVLGRVVKAVKLVDAPSPLGAARYYTGLRRTTPYGPYRTEFDLDEDGLIPNTHLVLDGYLKQQSVRAELSACPKEWVPDLMTSAGSTVKFEARLVGPSKRPAKWKFTIEESSRNPGMCNNADLPPRLLRQWQNKVTQHSEDLLFDFRKYDGTRQPRFRSVVGAPYKILETKEASSEPVQFEVSCLDFGAYGRLIAEADFGYGWVRAVVRQTNEPLAHIPYAPNIDEARRHMALAAKTYEGNPKYADLLPEPDQDRSPRGNGFDGDGLSNFEEYRGFFVRQGNQQVHRRLDPDKKDLFVFMSKITGQRLARYLPDFERASGLAVHRAGNDPLTQYIQAGSRLINFNSQERRAKPQTALRLTTGDLPGGLVGQSLPEHTGFGPPVNVTSIQIDWNSCLLIEGLNRPFTVDFTKSTVIHELGHGAGIRHHGNTNQTLASGQIVAVEGGQNSGEFACAMRYTDATFLRHYRRVPRAPDAPLSLGDLLPSYEDDLHVYDMTPERNGLVFCTDRTGTGINMVIPNSHDYYCGDATRGNCQNQIVVNDRYGSGGSGSTARQTSAGAPPSENIPASNNATAEVPPAEGEPLDEAERAAVESQASAGLSVNLAFADERVREIVPGEAIVFDLHVGQYAADVELSGEGDAPRAKHVTRLGAEGKPWTGQVTFLVLDETGKLVAAPVALTPVGKTVQAAAADGATEKEPSTAATEEKPQLELQADHGYTAGFAADGASTATLAPGKYRLFAAVATSEPGLPERVLSGSVVLVVKGEADLPEPQQKQIASRRQLSEAKLAFRAERFADCEKLCRSVIAEAPDWCDAQLLLAQSLHRQKKLREALAAYNQSLACLKPNLERMPEPPRAILLTIHALEQELGIKPEPRKIEPEPGPLVEAALVAETAAGKAEPPFAPTSRRIVFSWKAGLNALKEPLEARWIAADVAGLAPASLLSTTKSEDGKSAGEFELKPPEGGFAAGSYRLEIGMAGKRLYVVTFEVRAESR